MILQKRSQKLVLVINLFVLLVIFILSIIFAIGKTANSPLPTQANPLSSFGSYDIAISPNTGSFYSDYDSKQFSKVLTNNSELSKEAEPVLEMLSQEEFIVKTRSYEVYLNRQIFIPEPRKREESNDYFKSLNLTEDELYVVMLFEGLDGDPSEEQIQTLNKEGVKLLNYQGDHAYFAKVPAEFLETKHYDFIRWIEVINPESKILLDLNSNENILTVIIKLYEPLNSDQLSELNSLINNLNSKTSSNFLEVEVLAENLYKVASLNFIKSIEKAITPIINLDRSVQITAADYVQSSYGALGVTVGIIDSGIIYNHAHFNSPIAIPIYDAVDYVDGGTPTDTGLGHGVAIAGMISGQGSYNARTFNGLSNRARLVIQRVFDANGSWGAPSSALPDIWENILDPDNDQNYIEHSSADVISASWGNNESANDGNYTLDSEQADLTVMGENGKEVPIIFSVGNDGISSYPKIGPPSTAKNVISVGATADCATDSGICGGPNFDPNNLYVVGSSSRNTDDGRVKPDILAPGGSITSSNLSGSYSSRPTGTSFAAPHVSAVAAQLLDRYPSLSPAGVKAFLISSTVGGGTTDNKNINQGWGRLSAARTVYQLDDEYIDGFGESTVYEQGSSVGITQICYGIDIPTGADRIVTTLVWSDVPGENSPTRTLYNDLDLRIKYPNGTYIPWTENDDDKNNVEKYIIEDPSVTGLWFACVRAIGDLYGNSPQEEKQEYAIKYEVIKRSTTPSINVSLNLASNAISINQSTDVYATVDVEGLYGYDLRADLNYDAGLNLTSSALDGSDADKDTLGDIPAGKSRITRLWNLNGLTIGNNTLTINVSGKRIDGEAYSAIGTAYLQVFNQSSNSGSGNITNCTAPGYEFCIAYTHSSGCDVSIATNLYENVNNIKWGQINDSFDPYVVKNYTVGWTDVDADTMYYGIDNPNGGACGPTGCNGQILPQTGSMATVLAPGIAHHEEILGHEVTLSNACWVWFLDFNPNYGANNPIYVLNCFEDSDCSIGNYCNKTGSWNQWSCVAQKSNGQSCTTDTQCSSGFCDNDGLGLSDDGWCFEPVNVTFDSQEPSYCEVSTGAGINECDEKQVGQNITLCNKASLTYFEDKCSNICEAEESGNLCRSSAYATGCTASSQCNGVVAGTGQCNLDCAYNSQPPTDPTLIYPNGGQTLLKSNLVTINWSLSTDPDNWFTSYSLDYSNNSGTTWYSIVSDYGYQNKLNDSSLQKTLNYAGNENKTIYIKIPKVANVKRATFDLTGYQS